MQDGFADGDADTVALPLQFIQRIDLQHAWHQNPAGANTATGEASNAKVIAGAMDPAPPASGTRRRSSSHHGC